MPKSTTRPYLLSIGVGIPAINVWWHGYRDVKRTYKLRQPRFLGIQFVWISYRKVEPK